MKPSSFIVAILIVFWIKGAYLSKEKQLSQSPTQLLVEPNRQVNLTFTHNITNYDTILWYQRSPGDTSLKLIAYVYFTNLNVEKPFEGNFQVSGDGRKTVYLHILNPRHPEDSGEYFGAARGDSTGGYEAFFGGGTKLTVLERDVTEPEEVKILGPSEHECRNGKDKKRKKTLVCVASGFYPDHVEVYWQMNEKNVTDGVATDEAAERIETPPVSYRITSRLRVSAKDWFTEGKNFTCFVSFNSGNATTKYNDTIFGVEDKEDRGTGREKYLKITNKAKLSYAVFIFKSCLYGAFVGFLVWRLQSSPGKRKK